MLSLSFVYYVRTSVFGNYQTIIWFVSLCVSSFCVMTQTFTITQTFLPDTNIITKWDFCLSLCVIP